MHYGSYPGKLGKRFSSIATRFPSSSEITVSYLDFIKNNYGTNLIALWLMDEASGTTAKDSSVESNNGAYSNATLANAIGPTRTNVPAFNGTSGYVNIYSSAFNSDFNGSEGSIVTWLKVNDATFWDEGAHRTFIRICNDWQQSYVILKKHTGNDSLLLQYMAGNNLESIFVYSYGHITDWIMLGATWSKAADQVIFYINGVANLSPTTGLGVWSRPLGSGYCCIGSLNTTPGELMKGWIGPTSVWTRPLSAAEMLAIAQFGLPKFASNQAYMAASFQNGYQPEQLQICNSDDGIAWNYKHSVYSPANRMRDPSICRIGSTIWLAHNNVTATTFTVAKSTDNGNSFVHVANVTVTTPGVSAVYAPEWFVDSDNSVHLLLCLGVGGGYGIYETHPTNAGYTTWSNPVVIDEGDTDINIQDPYMVKVGSTYYLWYTDGANVNYSSSNTLLGPYTSVAKHVFAGAEGECIIKLPNGVWRAYMDRNPATPNDPGIHYSESTDAWATWTTPVLCTFPFTSRHGTIILADEATNFVYSSF